MNDGEIEPFLCGVFVKPLSGDSVSAWFIDNLQYGSWLKSWRL